MKRLKTILITLTILVILTAGIFNLYLPKIIKNIAQTYVSGQLDKNIEIGKIRVFPGVYCKNIIIYEESKDTPYLSIKSLSFIPDYLTLISQRKFVAASLKIKGGFFHLKRDAQGNFNIPLPQAKKQTPPSSSTHETNDSKDTAHTNQIPIRKLSIRETTFVYSDEAKEFKAELFQTDLTARIAKDGVAHFKLSFSLDDTNAQAQAKGTFSLADKSFDAAIEGTNIALVDYRAYLKDFLTLDGGTLKEAQFHLTRAQTLSIQGEATFDDLLAKKDGIELKGDGSLKVDYAPPAQTGRFEITADFRDVSVANIPRIGELSAIQGKATITNDTLSIPGLTAQLYRSPLEIKGSLKLKPTLAGEITLDYNAPLANLKGLAEYALGKEIQDVWTGKSQLKITLQPPEEKTFTSLKDIPTQLTCTLRLIIDEAVSERAQIKDINILGEFASSDLTFTNAIGTYQGEFLYKGLNCSLDGFLKNPQRPIIELSFVSPLFSSKLSTLYADDTFEIKELTLEADGSKVTASGTVNPREKTHKLGGLGYIAAGDVTKAIKTLELPQEKNLNTLNPQGVVNVKFISEGFFTPDQWIIKLAGVSEGFRLYNLLFENMKIELYRDEKELIISPLRADFYQGKVDFRLKSQSTNNLSVINLIVNDMELAQAAADFPGEKKKKVGGRISAEVYAENKNGLNPKAWQGEGKATVQNAKIWEISFLQGLGHFLFIPEFGDIVFEEGYGEFIIKDENIYLDNAELSSYKMRLQGQGKIGFDKTIDFLFFPTFNPNMLSASESLKKITSKLLGKVLAIHVEGTLDKPTYKMPPIVFSPIDRFKKMFEGLLQ